MDTEQSQSKREVATVSINSHPVTEDRDMLYVVGGAHALILKISSYFGLAPLRFEPQGNGYTVTISNAMCIYSYGLITILGSIVINQIGFYLLWFVLVLLELQFAFTAFSVYARFRAVNDAFAHTALELSMPGKKSVVSSPMNIYAIRVAVQSHGYSNDMNLLVNSVAGNEHVVIIRRASGEPKLLVPPCEAIRRLAKLHNSLCSVVQEVCNSYSLLLIVILISTLMHLIETPYLLLMEIIRGTPRIYFIVLLFFWCIIHVVRVFLVVEPCHYTIGEGKKTEKLVCRMMTSTASTSKLITRLDLFSRQLMLQSVSYTPMGMYTLDRPLIATILGTVTTYLVILIQFQRTEE